MINVPSPVEGPSQPEGVAFPTGTDAECEQVVTYGPRPKRPYDQE